MPDQCPRFDNISEGRRIIAEADKATEALAQAVIRAEQRLERQRYHARALRTAFANQFGMEA